MNKTYILNGYHKKAKRLKKNEIKQRERESFNAFKEMIPMYLSEKEIRNLMNQEIQGFLAINEL